LINCLQRNGFHVLEAGDWEQVFHVVRVHSRQIHLLLMDESMEARVPMLRQHRSELQVVLAQKPVDVDAVLVEVRKVLHRRHRLQFADGWFIAASKMLCVTGKRELPECRGRSR
jgi:hypothetical protein